jgi:hypothetical protein
MEPTQGGFVDILVNYRPYVLALHLLGVALGLGGATITDIFFFRFMKDFRISQKEAEVMQTLSNIIMTALYLLLISGVLLYLMAIEEYNQSAGFQFKMIAVAVLAVNGFFMHRRIAPRMIDISFRQGGVPTPELRKLRRIAFAMGAISMTSWYSAFLVAMLKKQLPADTGLLDLLGIYAFIVILAVTVSECVEMYMTRQSRLKSQAPVV